MESKGLGHLGVRAETYSIFNTSGCGQHAALFIVTKTCRTGFSVVYATKLRVDVVRNRKQWTRVCEAGLETR